MALVKRGTAKSWVSQKLIPQVFLEGLVHHIEEVSGAATALKRQTQIT